MLTPRLRTTLAFVVATGTVAAAAGPAHAATTTPLSGGATTLKLDPGAARALKTLGVKVSVTGRAKAGRAGVSFPITGGRIDPATAAGTVRHAGGLRLRAGKVAVTLSDFVVTAGPRPTMTAKVNGGARLAALTPVLGRAKVSHTAASTTVSGVAIRLSAKGARALNQAFHVKAFTAKLKLGTAKIAAKLAEISLVGGQTELALDPGVLAALGSLGVTPGVVGPAVAGPDGAIGFPITGGAVNAKTLAGTITHAGGLSLSKDGTTVTLADFTVDTTAGQLTATVNGGARVAILTLDLSAPAVQIAGQAVRVGNVGASLTPGAAEALNAAFGTTAFTGGLKIGTTTVQGQSA